MAANDKQEGGRHYKTPDGIEHWDIVWRFELDYFQGQITKYVMRWKLKGGVQDLKKARHFLDKYIELIEEEEGPGPGYVNQDRCRNYVAAYQNNDKCINCGRQLLKHE